MSHQSRLVSYILLNKLLICLKCDITPLYMCATQTTLNRLKQPKNFYRVRSGMSAATSYRGNLSKHMIS